MNTDRLMIFPLSVLGALAAGFFAAVLDMDPARNGGVLCVILALLVLQQVFVAVLLFSSK